MTKRFVWAHRLLFLGAFCLLTQHSGYPATRPEFESSLFFWQSSSGVSSTLQIIAIDGKDPHPTAVYTTPGYFEAPNWSKDGSSLLFDQDGKLMKLPVAGGRPEVVQIAPGMRCNGSHGFSPDGKLLAISCSAPELPGSHVYTMPYDGGTPRLVTEHTNSYWHSWSPDGKTIIFTRPDHSALNLNAIPVDGGKEVALTSGTGISDDPDYSPDGKYIYFCSDRGGSMQIWRMHPDGGAVEQMTADDLVNWTPHISPDGRWMVFLSYEKGVTGHPANKNVALRLMSLPDRKVHVLVNLVGGSGTINVPSWSPDSRRLAFVSFQVMPSQ